VDADARPLPEQRLRSKGIPMRTTVYSRLTLNSMRRVLSCLFLSAIVSVPSLPASAAGIVSSAAVSETDTGMRFDMQITGSVDARAYVLANPYRVVLDMPTVEFRVPQGTGLQPSGFVKEFRYGLVGKDRARIIFDVDGPTLAGTPRLTAGPDGKTMLLSLDLVPTDKSSFMARLAPKKPAAKVASTDPIGIIPKPKPADPRQNRPLIVIDPGHGGPDSGAVSPNGQLEKDLVLAIAKVLRDKLIATNRFKVLMTRETDVFITLKGRVDFAQAKRADLFVSIHADSTQRGRRWQRVSGGTIYTRAERATDEQSRLLAAKENAADLMAGEERGQDENDTMSNIGVDWARQETKGLTQALASELVDRLRAAVPMTPDAHRQAAFYVLRSPDVPSVLIETGYVNNKSDVGNLTSPEWRQGMAGAIAQAVDKYFVARDEGGIGTIFGIDGALQP
jgi:N-acetylmuramoyl-L-alanine amidase